jgi:zinc/manganese transport system substrate-binding protein
MSTRTSLRLVLLLVLAGLIGAACSGKTAEPDQVVVTTTVLGDIVASITAPCDGEPQVLMAVGQDPHSFQASAAQAAAVRSARLTVANGLGLEEGLGSLLEAAASDGIPVLEIAEQLDPIPFTGTTADDDVLDPHVWLDPARMADAVTVIGASLAAVDPDNSDCYTDAAATYREQILETDAEIERTLAPIPTDHRILVTNHGSLGYFADRYGFEILGTIIPGGSTLAEPSPKELAELVEAIRQVGVDAIFVDSTQPQKLAEAVSKEVGYPVQVVGIYTGSLGPAGSGAETYPTMLATNADRIADALGG